VSILCALVTVYMLVLFVRAILSWFPIRHGSAWSGVYAIVFDVTEPVLAPLRRVIPPIGIFDLSFIVLFFGLAIVRGVLC
jgi:YggT family protein